MGFGNQRDKNGEADGGLLNLGKVFGESEWIPGVGDGYVYGLDGGYGFTGVSYLQIHPVVYSKYV